MNVDRARERSQSVWSAPAATSTMSALAAGAGFGSVGVAPGVDVTVLQQHTAIEHPPGCYAKATCAWRRTPAKTCS